MFSSDDQNTSINDCQLIELPKVEDRRGNISFIEGERHVPFRIARTYWIYDVPGGQVRTGHAYKRLQEFIIAISGSFDVVIDDGSQKRVFSLNRSYYGLYVPCGMWRSLNNFSTNSLGMILTSMHYNESDYIRDYETYVKAKS